MFQTAPGGPIWLFFLAAASVARVSGLAASSQPATPLAQMKQAYESGGESAAVSFYEQWTRRTGSPDASLLVQLASWTVSELSKAADADVRNAACAATVPYSRDKFCVSALQALMNDANATFAARLVAVNALKAAQDPFADKALQSIASQAAAQHPVDAAALLSDVAPSISVPLLRNMLAGADPQQQYAAAFVLAGMTDKSATEALAQNVDHVSGAAKIAAVAGLAGAGDAANRAKLVEALPLLRGRDLLVAGRALQRVGDPRGTRTLTGLLGSDDESLALDAAAALTTGPEQARAKAAVHAGVLSKNPVVRAQALKLWRRAGWPSDPDIRMLLADADPWVRIEAAAVVMKDAHPAPPRTR